MMSSQSSGRRGLLWAILGGLVLVAGVVGIIIAAVLQSPPASSPTPTIGHGSREETSAAPDAPGGDVVDRSVAERGWKPEPITSDAETYISAALEAASTFDTQKGTRDEWLSYLDTWFTPDTRYSAADRDDRLRSAQVELRQGVVLPREEWDSLALEKGRVVTAATGPVGLLPVAEDASGDMIIGTADVTLTFTRSDGGDGQTSYDEQARVSVQVLCGADSVPTPNSAQQAGDCKVVRFFTEPLEP